MTEAEKQRIPADLALHLMLLDYYAQNRDSVKSMNDHEYREYIDLLLDEINRLKKLLAQNDPDDFQK